MQFINTNNNTIYLSDINKIIPFFEDLREQSINEDEIKKSDIFKNFCISNPPVFIIKSILDNKIEKNLYLLQNNMVKFEDNIDRIPVLFQGHFSNNSGYSKSNRNLLYSLLRYKFLDISIKPMSGLEGLPAAETAFLEKLVKIPDPDSIFLHSTIPSFGVKSDSRYSILYTTVESSTVPKQFLDICDNYDEVWVTSDFCKESLINSGLNKSISVIPNGVNDKNYNELGSKIDIKPKLNNFVFLSVFGWNYRKGYDALIRAYLEEFNNSDVSLLICTPYEKNDAADSYIKEMKHKYKSNAHIARMGYSLIEGNLSRLYRSCDAFVLPSRGEGMCLTILEASLCGLPIISTNYSGHTMFCNKGNSNLVDIDNFEKLDNNETGVHYWDGQLFPNLKSDNFINNLRKTMRDVYTNLEDNKVKNKALQNDILSKYTCNIIGDKVKDRIKEIWKQIQY